MAWEASLSARSRTDLEQTVKYIARDDPAAAKQSGLKETLERIRQTAVLATITERIAVEFLGR
jgi:plasmid stabilization system protein ParE